MNTTLTIVAFGVFASMAACKKNSDAENTAPALQDPDDGIEDPEFPTGTTLADSGGCVATVTDLDTKFPMKLSATGCFPGAEHLTARTPVPGALSFTVRNSFHTGVARKERHLLVPQGTQIEMHATGPWKLPAGTVALKTFTIEGQPIETRILKRTTAGLRAASYKWNPEGTDADWIGESTWESFAGMDWLYPSEYDCKQCHTPAAGEFLGWETRQLNTRHDMLGLGHDYNQISTLAKLGLLAGNPEPPPADQRYVKLDEDLAGLSTQEVRARTWIHLNCAYCHMPESSGNGEIDLRFDASLADMKTCNVDDQHGDLGVPDSKVLVPGKPDLSNFWLRMISQDISLTMPLYSTMPPSPAGAELVKAWISSLQDCTPE